MQKVNTQNDVSLENFRRNVGVLPLRTYKLDAPGSACAARSTSCPNRFVPPAKGQSIGHERHGQRIASLFELVQELSESRGRPRRVRALRITSARHFSCLDYCKCKLLKRRSNVWSIFELPLHMKPLRRLVCFLACASIDDQPWDGQGLRWRLRITFARKVTMAGVSLRRHTLRPKRDSRRQR